MRRYFRKALPLRAESWLKVRQRELGAIAPSDLGAHWRKHRPSMNEEGIVSILKVMVGARQRCMFCGDSVATDVEHFWPKSVFPEKMFVWSNLLWVCNSCNRKKGTRFPLNDAGEPLLVDPTSRAPWAHLFFVPATGEIVARVSPVTGEEDPWGRATVDPDVLPLNIESVTQARLRAWRSLRRDVGHFLNSPGDAAAVALLAEAVRENERPELVLWALVFEGKTLDPFRQLLDRHPQLKRQLVELVLDEELATDTRAP